MSRFEQLDLLFAFLQRCHVCQSELHSFLCELPKCEHHLHIKGTITPDMLFRLATKNGISLSSDDPAFSSPLALSKRYLEFSSLDDFSNYYFIGFSVLVNAPDFEDLTFDYIQNAYRQGVRHSEIFFDPQAHTERGIPYTSIISGVTAAKARASVAYQSMSVEFIPCLIRHLPVASASAMLSEIVSHGHFMDGTLTGFGMSST